MPVKIGGAFYRMSEPEGTSVILEKGLGRYLVLHFYQPMIITIDNEEIITEKDAFIVYTPNTPQSYRSVSGGFVNDYVSFIADPNFIKQFDVPLNEVFYCEDPTAVSNAIAFITWALTDVLVDHSKLLDEQLNLVLQTLQDTLVIITAKSKREHMMRKRFIELREQIRKNPSEWTVDKMAKKIYLTRSHFCINYKEQFGITPRDDLLNFTIDYAKKLLEETDLPIWDIAEKCGYVNANNFIRAFKNITGTTPLKFRKNK